MINGIHHIALHTPRFEAMIRFYTEALGFGAVGDVFAWKDNPEIDAGIGVPNSAARTIMLHAGNCFVELFEYSSPPARDTGALRPNDHGYTHFALDVVDIENEMERLAGHGMTFADTAPMTGDGLRSIYGKDPDGNLIELQELSPDHPFVLRK